MVHGTSAEDVQQMVQRVSRACRVSNYRILVTEKGTQNGAADIYYTMRNAKY